MKVTGWANWEDGNYLDTDQMTLVEFNQARDAIIEEIRSKGYKFTGTDHQCRHGCCPIIDNKYIYCVSQRNWGK